jgi:lambda repressor-like predicted transcriptional regulator
MSNGKSNGEKSKGGLKSWATAEQKTWLALRLQSYVASKLSTKPSEFWPSVFEDWNEKWPLGESADDEGKSREEQAKHRKVVSAQVG